MNRDEMKDLIYRALSLLADEAELGKPWPAMVAEHNLGGVARVREARDRLDELTSVPAPWHAPDAS